MIDVVKNTLGNHNNPKDYGIGSSELARGSVVVLINFVEFSPLSNSRREDVLDQVSCCVSRKLSREFNLKICSNHHESIYFRVTHFVISYWHVCSYIDDCIDKNVGSNPFRASADLARNSFLSSTLFE